MMAEEQLETLQKALGISGVRKKADWEIKNLVVVSDGKTIRLIAERGNKKPGYSLVVCGVTNGLECRCNFDANSIPLIAGPYQVMLTATYARFVHTGTYALRYFVGADLRRSAVRNMVEKMGWSETKAMMISGHKTNEMLRRYNIIPTGDIKESGRQADGWWKAQREKRAKKPKLIRKGKVA